MKRALSILLIAVILTGCAHQVHRDAPVVNPASHVFNKNYILGEVKTVSVGEALIQVRDYYVTKIGTSAVTPSEDFTVNGTLVHETFTVGQKLDIKGKITLNDTEYSMAKFVGNDYAYKALLIKQDGTIHTKIGNYSPQFNGVIPLIYSYTIMPETAKMLRVEKEEIVTSKGYQNYEFLYNGSDANSMYFTYREYSPTGIARTAFYQNLTYKADAPSIRFKGFKLNVIESNGEEVKFIVEEDGIEK